MEKKVYTYIDPVTGMEIPVTVKVNKKLTSKKRFNKKSKEEKAKGKKSNLAKKIARTLLLAVATGTIIQGSLSYAMSSQAAKDITSVGKVVAAGEYQASNEDEKEEEQVEENEIADENLRFDPNSRETIVENAVFLVEDAAKAGKKLDAEDAVLTVITANINEITPGFMGEVFGETKDQKYTYSQLVDSYLRVGLMQTENMAIAKNDDLAFNVENIFANKEDHEYLSSMRNLVTRFNNSQDENEKKQIADELNKIAFDLTTYEAHDISSAASVLSMLSLDGVRIYTNTNTNYTVLPDDIRDEMFGNGNYSCTEKATFTSEDGMVLETQYSNRVSDLKVDAVEKKLENAILEEGKQPQIASIIKEVNDRTKDVQVADINTVDEINKVMEENRNIPYAYEIAPGVTNPNYSPKTESDQVVTTETGEQVIVAQDNTKNQENNGQEKNGQENNAAKSQEQAQKEHQQKVENEQAEANKGAADGKYYGENGLAKPSLSGKSQTYINAFNASYDAYKALYDANQNSVKEETVPPDENKTSDDNQTNDVESTTNITIEEEIIPVEPETNTQQQTQVPQETVQQTSDPYETMTYTNENGATVVEEIILLEDMSLEQLEELRQAAMGEEPIYIEEGKTR